MMLSSDIENIILRDSSEPGKFAAAELQKYFKKITGRNLPVIRSSDSIRKEHSFVLETDGMEAEDGFSIKCSDRGMKIQITGANPRSLVYGVYYFLKKVFGIRWTSPGPDGEILKKTSPVNIKDFQVREKAMLKYRGFYVDSAQCSITPENIGEIIDWMAKNFGNFILVSRVFYPKIKRPLLEALKQRGMILEVGHHGFNCYVNPSKYFKKHPEWFSLIKGQRTPGTFHANMVHNSQLCTSNKECVDFYSRAFLDYWEANPEIDILGIIPNDGFGWCECQDCMKLEPKKLTSPLRNENLNSHKDWKLGSGRYHHFVKEVSDRVSRCFQEKKIDFWAYAGVIMPSPIVSEFPENVILTIALYERWYNYSLNDPAGRKIKENLNPKLVDILKDWRKKFPGEINIYEYYQKYIWRSMPKWMPEIIRNDMRFFKKENLQGVLSMVEKDNFLLYEINHLSHMAMSWSDAWTSDSLLDDYSETSFGSMKKTIKNEIKKVISAMGSYAKLGPQYPRELTPNAEKTFRKLEKDFGKIANTGKHKMPLKSAAKLGKWAKNMKLTHEHFSLNKLYYEMLDAVNEKNASEALKILDKWEIAKRQFYKTFNSLDGTGVCLSNDLWIFVWSKNLLEYEGILRKELEQATKNPNDDFSSSLAALGKLQDIAS
ncbi:MAG: hypothetical protein A2017_21965 [Lentisphaerae bacterium GWF2_44_16]|nr:MAG: hypothetical protein A2017_21965 [Lentisphaerae bacterium GWF2_44_16]